MQLNVALVLLSAITCICITGGRSLAIEEREQELNENTEDYCMSETFQPRCNNKKAILINSATYGRMHIGRCITKQEINAFGAALNSGADQRFLGCSADVLSIMDGKCSGKTECDVRHLDVSTELSQEPCFPGLKVYLKVSYDCIAIADEDHSCTLTVSKIPSYIFASFESQRKCATKSQPWLIEAPTGQKIKITLIDFLASQITQRVEKKRTKSCFDTIIDKAGKRNVSFCVGGEQRTSYFYTSKAENLEIYYNKEEEHDDSDDRGSQFALKLEAVGCSDLIAPEDAWLKRNDDSIVIGCYSNRLSWELHCDGERWIGVFGNCSQGIDNRELLVEESEFKERGWSNEQVLTVVAVGGFTLLICLTVLCTGIVCLRRFSQKKMMKSQDYKVIDLQIDSSINKTGIDGITNSTSVTHQQMAPTYSVFVGEDEFNAIAPNNRQ